MNGRSITLLNKGRYTVGIAGTTVDRLSSDSGGLTPSRPSILRGRAAVARQAHNLEATGSNPVLTTKKHLKPFGVITRRKSIFAS
jgi:hypothetical protein